MIMSKTTLHRATRGPDGRSFMTSELVDLMAGGLTTTLWAGDMTNLPAALGSSSPSRDIGVPSNGLRWALGRFPPGWSYAMHQSNTWDLHAIIQGRAISILDDGPQEIKAGEFLIMEGVDHAWEAGPEGYISAMTVFGTQPAAG